MLLQCKRRLPRCIITFLRPMQQAGRSRHQLRGMRQTNTVRPEHRYFPDSRNRTDKMKRDIRPARCRHLHCSMDGEDNFRSIGLGPWKGRGGGGGAWGHTRSGSSWSDDMDSVASCKLSRAFAVVGFGPGGGGASAQQLGERKMERFSEPACSARTCDKAALSCYVNATNPAFAYVRVEK